MLVEECVGNGGTEVAAAVVAAAAAAAAAATAAAAVGGNDRPFADIRGEPGILLGSNASCPPPVVSTFVAIERPAAGLAVRPGFGNLVKPRLRDKVGTSRLRLGSLELRVRYLGEFGGRGETRTAPVKPEPPLLSAEKVTRSLRLSDRCALDRPRRKMPGLLCTSDVLGDSFGNAADSLQQAPTPVPSTADAPPGADVSSCWRGDCIPTTPLPLLCRVLECCNLGCGLGVPGNIGRKRAD
mmetsp:Transcript_14637/g.28360  ORF Transcript_14637/g.28360 Transcript_14637/m.28360 type:complete len:240 (+) Transcript_14637:412-1131(+)